MSSQTGARGAPRFRGRGQPRADSEPRSDNERRDANVDRKRASEKNNFTVRGGALTRGNPFIRGGDGGARNQAGQKARGTESQKLSESSRENTREPRASNSSRGDRGSTRSQAGSSGERVTRKSKEDAIQGHFVKYLRGGNPVRGRGSTRTNARGGNIARSGTRHHSDRALSSSNSSPNWRDPRHDGGGSYMQNMSELYQTIKKSREQERKEAIRKGTLADPDKPTSLANAITPVGTCQDMCPEFERVERIVQNMVDGCEKGEAESGSTKVPYEEFMVKRFRRSAAGYDEQLPSDIRPPLVLKKTLVYLIGEVVGNADDLGSVHKFVWDRTRGIRNDFSIQQVTKKDDILLAVDCFERIARFHILSLHLLSQPGNEDFDHHQEREQLNNTLLSLMYYYDDNKKRMKFPNEAEFRSYCIVSEIQDQRPDLEDRMQNWGLHLLKDPRIKNALKIYAAAGSTVDEQGPLRPRASFSLAQGNYGRFWAAVDSSATSYLLACACEMYFNLVRSNALETIVKAYRRSSTKNSANAKRSDDLILSDILHFLGFDTEEEVQTFCEEHGFTIGEREDGEGFLDVSSVQLGGFSDSNPRRKQIFSEEIVESKRHGRSIPALINGLSVAKAREQGLVSERPSREVSMDEAEEDIDSAEDASSVEGSNKAQSASPTKATFQNSLTPGLSTAGNSIGPVTKPTPIPATSGPRNPFDTATIPSKPTSAGLPSPSLKVPKTTSDEPTNPFLLSSVIKPLNNPFGLTPSAIATSKPFESNSGNPATSKLLPFSAAMKQFDASTSTPSFDSGTLKQATAVAKNSPTEQAAFQFNQPPKTSTSPFSTIQKSSLPPLNPSFKFADALKAAQPATPATGQSAKQPPTNLDQPLTPATTPGSTPSTESITTGTAKAPLFNFATPTATPPRAKTPPTTTFQVGLSQGSALPTFSIPAPPKLLLQPAQQAVVEKEPSTLHQTATTSSIAPQATLVAAPSTLIAAIDHQKESKNKVIDQLAWDLMTEGDKSYMEQFLEFTLRSIVKESMDTVQKENDDSDVERFRTWYLSRKYGRMWRKITWDSYLLRQREARMKRLAEARKAAAEEAEREAAEKENQNGSMQEAQKRQPRPKSTNVLKPPSQVFSSPTKTERVLSNSKRTIHPSNTYVPRSPTSSNPTSSGKKRKQVRDEAGYPDEDHVPKRVRTMLNSSLRSLNSSQNSQRDLAAGSWKKHAEMENRMLEAQRFGPVVKTDTTRSTYFKMIAMGLDPNTPIVPLTKKDIAEAERKAASEAMPEPNRALDDGNESTGQTFTQGLAHTPKSDKHVLQPIIEATTTAINRQPTIENTMGPPQTPMRHTATINGPSKARCSPEDQALYDQVAEIKAQLDSGAEWYREEIERIRRSTSSRSSPAHPLQGSSSKRNRPYHISPSSQRSTASAHSGIIRGSPPAAAANPSPNLNTPHIQTNGVKNDTATSDRNSPTYWRQRIAKIYNPDAKADEAKRSRFGVLANETPAQKRLREFNANTPSRTQVRLASSGGKDGWLAKSAYGQQKAAQAKKKGKGKGRAQDWGDLDYVDAEMSDDERLDEEGNAEMTEPKEEEEEEGEGEEEEEWDGQDDDEDAYDDDGIGFAANGFSGSAQGNGMGGRGGMGGGGGGGTGASADDAIEL